MVGTAQGRLCPPYKTGRHCERSEAIDTLPDVKHTSAISPPNPREFFQNIAPPEIRGRREMPGARCTRGLVCKVHKGNAHEHTGSAEAPRHSLRNGFTAYNALSPATNSFCHRHPRIEGFAKPGRARNPPRT